MKSGQRQQAVNNSKRLHLIPCAVCTLLFALCFTVEAQQTQKLPRLGFLSNRVKPTVTTPDLFEDAFRDGLRRLGYSEETIF